MVKLFFLLCFCVQGLFCQGPTISPFVQGCSTNSDIVLVLDQSGSVSPNYHFLIGFAVFLANFLKLQDDGSGFRLGVVTYNETARRVIELNDYGFDKFKTKAETSLGQEMGKTNIADGLRKAYEMIKDTSKGARVGVKKLIVFTNGGKGNVEEDQMLAERMKIINDAENIDIIIIGITSTIVESILVASYPKEKFFFFIPKFATLNTTKFLDNISTGVCRGAVEPNAIEVNVSHCIGIKSPVLTLNFAGLNNNDLTFAVVLPNDAPFCVDENTGVIFTTGEEYYNSANLSFKLVIEVSDMDSNTLPFAVKIIILVLNDTCVGTTRAPLACSTRGNSYTRGVCNDNPGLEKVRYPGINGDQGYFINCEAGGICQLCNYHDDFNLVFSDVCQHCVSPDSDDACVTTTPTPA